MNKTMQVIESLYNLSAAQQVFIVSVLAISVAGLALYVVLTALKSIAGKGGSE